MASVLSVLGRSLRLIGAVDVQETLHAEDSVTALSALNAMCRRWEANGLAIGWVTVDLSDDMPSPDEAEEAIVYNLAVRLGPEYGLPSSFGVITTLAQQFLTDLRRDRLAEAPLTLCNDLPLAESYGRWNILTDEAV